VGSKVSICEGPPFMKRKMTRFARAGKCGRFGSSECLGADSEAAKDNQPPSESTLVKASAPNPPPSRLSISRRVRNDWPALEELTGSFIDYICCLIFLRFLCGEFILRAAQSTYMNSFALKSTWAYCSHFDNSLPLALCSAFSDCFGEPSRKSNASLVSASEGGRP